MAQKAGVEGRITSNGSSHRHKRSHTHICSTLLYQSFNTHHLRGLGVGCPWSARSSLCSCTPFRDLGFYLRGLPCRSIAGLRLQSYELIKLSSLWRCSSDLQNAHHHSFVLTRSFLICFGNLNQQHHLHHSQWRKTFSRPTWVESYRRAKGTNVYPSRSLTLTQHSGYSCLITPLP